MGVLDGPMAAVARSLIGSLGGSGTYIQPGSGGSYNPATGNVEASGSDTETSCAVAPGGPGMLRLFDITLIEQGDVTAIVSRLGLGFAPTPGSDRLTWQGVTGRVVAAERYSSGDQDAAYALLLRK